MRKLKDIEHCTVNQIQKSNEPNSGDGIIREWMKSFDNEYLIKYVIFPVFLAVLFSIAMYKFL